MFLNYQAAEIERYLTDPDYQWRVLSTLYEVVGLKDDTESEQGELIAQFEEEAI